MYSNSYSSDTNANTTDDKSTPVYSFDGFDIVSSEKVALTPPATTQNRTVVRTKPGAN